MEGCAIGLKITIWWSIKRHSSKGRLQRWNVMMAAWTGPEPHISILLAHFCEIVDGCGENKWGWEICIIGTVWWIGVRWPKSDLEQPSSVQYPFKCWDEVNDAVLCFASWLHYIHYCGCERNEREEEENKKEKAAAGPSESVHGTSMDRRGVRSPCWLGESKWEDRFKLNNSDVVLIADRHPHDLWSVSKRLLRDD